MAIRAGIQYLWNPTPFYAHGVSVWGYNIRALHIPCIALATGARPGEPLTMYDDAAFIADHVTCLADRCLRRFARNAFLWGNASRVRAKVRIKAKMAAS